MKFSMFLFGFFIVALGLWGFVIAVVTQFWTPDFWSLGFGGFALIALGCMLMYLAENKKIK